VLVMLGCATPQVNPVLAKRDHAASGSLPPVDHFFKPDAIGAIDLSPTGRRMALSAKGGNGRMGVFVIDLQGSKFTITRAVLFGDADVVDFEWVNDERLVFSATDLQAGLAETYERAPGLYAARYDGTELRQLVETRGRSILSNGEPIRTLTWNHKLLHVPAPSEERSGANADEVIVGEMNFTHDDLISITPKWLNTRNAKTRPLSVNRVPSGARSWWFSAQGEPRAVRAYQKGREALHWYQAPRGGQSGQWKKIAEGPLFELDIQPLWVGQGDTLFVGHLGGKAGESVVAPFDFAKNVPGKTLVSSPGFDFEGKLIGDREGKRLLGVRIDTDAEQTIWFDGAYKSAQDRADETLPGRVNRIQCRRCGSNDAVILVLSYSDRDPGRLLLWRQADNGGKGAWQGVSTVRPDIKPQQMAGTDLHRIRARDGRDLPVWVTNATGADKAPLPAVVLVHGGPWVRGRSWNWQALPQYLASRGYVVIEPEFRGSEGYGVDHLRAGFKQWGQSMQDDVADALLWARQQGMANEAACIVGGSYGGYSALMGLVRHSDLYRCASAWVAVTDPFLYLEGSWWVDDEISGSARQYGLPQLVGDVKKDREMLLANSPLAQASHIKKPLQLVWGSEDRRVPIAHGNRLREALEKAGNPPEWIVLEGEAHGWRKTEHQVDFALKLEDFLARHLKPER
jgi:dipeptidyl aminopeptidase/acylaminoacyl peptidase